MEDSWPIFERTVNEGRYEDDVLAAMDYMGAEQAGYPDVCSRWTLGGGSRSPA